MMRILFLLPLFCFSAPSFALGTVDTDEITHTSVKKVTFTWVSNATGEATATTSSIYDGKIIGLTTDPDSTAPSDNYDVVINDADGHDVLLAAGMNRDATNTEHVSEASLSAVAGSKLSLSITNAGNAKEGVAIVWIR